MAVAYLDRPQIKPIWLPRPHPRLRRVISRRNFSAPVLVAILVVLGWTFDRTFCWYVYDPQYQMGRDILNQETLVLKFEVAGHSYEVRTPTHPLTAEQTQAYWYYAGKQGFPAWTVDGPLAVDP